MDERYYKTGLINVGGILTETKYRRSLATAEAKEAVGLDPNQTYEASVGIAQVKERLIFNTGQLEKDKNTYTVPIDTENYYFLITDIYSSEPTKDIFNIGIFIDDNRVAFNYKVNKNLIQRPLPQLYLAGGMKLVIAQETDIQNVTIALEFVDVINAQNSAFFPAPLGSTN